MSRRLTMRKISEVLRLNQCNLSKRAIAESVGVSPPTLKNTDCNLHRVSEEIQQSGRCGSGDPALG